MKNIFWRDMGTLGDAIFAAKCSVIAWYPTDDYYYGPAVLYTMFGDPALRIKRGAPTPVSERSVPDAVTNLSIAPNPAHRSTVVSFPATQAADTRLRIYDAAGGLVGEITAPRGAPCVRLDCSGWPPGIYFMSLFVPGSVSGATARKFVVQ